MPAECPGGSAIPSERRALYLYRGNQDTHFRLHGTNEPETIGTAVSSGCIRLFNHDIIDLYNRVPVGSPVVVLQEPGPVADLQERGSMTDASEPDVAYGPGPDVGPVLRRRGANAARALAKAFCRTLARIVAAAGRTLVLAGAARSAALPAGRSIYRRGPTGVGFKASLGR